MKQSPSEKKLYANLGPSKFSGHGFLGTDTRTVEEIISEDREKIVSAGSTIPEVVTLLKDLYDRTKNAFGAEIALFDSVTAQYFESMGKIPSPFKGDGVFEKGEVVVTIKSLQKQLIITSLSINLIEKHEFFQGKGSVYRLEPEDLLFLLKTIKK